MLEAQRHAEHRQERKVRGLTRLRYFTVRTDRRSFGNLSEKGRILYIVAGRESFLEEENVQGSIQFF